MQVQSDDITVPWGQAPDPIGYQYDKWRTAVFQDVQESNDQSKLYFLYDPVADDNCSTTGSRKGLTSIVVFDTNRRCFIAEVLLRVQGRVKMLFALPTPSPAGGTSLVVVTNSEDYGQYVLHFWRVEFQADGLTLSGDPRTLLSSPLIVGENYICSLREDAPELVVVYGPELNIACVNASAQSPQEPTNRFSVPGAQLTHFYDGFLSRGSIYFLSATPDEHLDHSRIHVLSLQSHQLTTQYCQADPQRGAPPARRQAAIDAISGFILLAGGEYDHGSGNVQRLVDYWVLDLSSFKWNQIPAQMPVPLIEPRLTTTHSGNVYVWGDYDVALPGMDPNRTHVRILRVRGLNAFNPPSYNQVAGGGAVPYPSAQPPYPAGQQQPYPSAGQPYSGSQPYPPAGAPAYPPPGQPSYPPAGGQQYPSQPYQSYNEGPMPGNYNQPPDSQAPPSYPYYPPQEKKKDCSIQ